MVKTRNDHIRFAQNGEEGFLSRESPKGSINKSVYIPSGTRAATVNETSGQINEIERYFE